ncbi:MAG: ribosome recycling factor [Helicobacteraceae bacterium]|jgi:ribosome recycling factor|nr:ribosome recycling factor [Helicobacteraceae bacterium]
MLKPIYDEAKTRTLKCVESLSHEFSGLRTGKVSSKIIESVKIDYFGTATPLNGIGSIATPDANTIVITPWDKSLVKEIEKAIQIANIGVNPSNNGASVILAFPPMTQEQRKETAKRAKAMAEKAKVAVRNVRQETNNKVKKMEKDKAITEDESKRAHDEVQKIVDDAIASIDGHLLDKEASILKI